MKICAFLMVLASHTMKGALSSAGDLAPEDLYGDLYGEEAISDELQSLSVQEVQGSLYLGWSC